jgi:hypothetical protein
MTAPEANQLHNPFLRNGKIWPEIRIDCTSFDPDLSLLSGETIMLTFPTQKWIELVARAKSVTSLFVDRPKAKDLNPLGALNLKNFTVSYPSHVKDWSFLQKFSSLLRLALHNTLSIQDLEIVGGLKQLEVFQLSGGYSKVLRLPSLVPLAGLKNLKVIGFAGVRFKNWSLSPLFNSPELRRFDCPLWWPKEEISALARQNTKLCSNYFEWEEGLLN